MNTRYFPYVTLPFGSISAQADIIFESAWSEVTVVAGAANGVDSDDNSQTARDRLGIQVRRKVSASVPDAIASAFGGARGSFDGISSFSIKLDLNLSTSGEKYPIAASYCKFVLDFRVEGQPEQAPIWTESISNFSSTTLGYGQAPFPNVWFSVTDQNNQLAGGQLSPGSYRAVIEFDLGHSDNFIYNGTTTWSSTSSLVFRSGTAAAGLYPVGKQVPLSNLVIAPAAVGQPARFSGTVSGGMAGGIANLQTSLDLGVTDPWTNIDSLVVDAQGTATFTNVPDTREEALGAPKLFFRIVTTPP